MGRAASGGRMLFTEAVMASAAAVAGSVRSDWAAIRPSRPSWMSSGLRMGISELRSPVFAETRNVTC